MASDELERDLTKSSIGYLSQADYKRKREELETEKALAALKKQANGADGGNADADGALPSEGKKKKKKDKNKKGSSALSFGDELEEGEAEASPGLAPKKMGKCQDVNVSFLELNENEKQQAAERQEAALREVLQQQKAARDEDLTLDFTFRNEVTQRELPGGVTRGKVVVKRGQAAEDVAIAVRSQVELLGGKFKPASVGGIREERDVVLVASCEGMPTGSFVIPGAVSLLELSTRRWADADATLFDDFKHGIIVTERRWYESWR